MGFGPRDRSLQPGPLVCGDLKSFGLDTEKNALFQKP